MSVLDVSPGACFNESRSLGGTPGPYVFPRWLSPLQRRLRQFSLSFTSLDPLLLRDRKIIPTVGAGDEKGVERQLKHFLADMDLSHDRSRLDRYLGRGEEKHLKILPPNKRRLEGGVGGKRKTFDFEKIDVEEQVLRWEELSKGLNSDGKVQERGRGWDEREFTSDTKEKGLGRKTVEVIVLDDDDN